MPGATYNLPDRGDGCPTAHEHRPGSVQGGPGGKQVARGSCCGNCGGASGGGPGSEGGSGAQVQKRESTQRLSSPLPMEQPIKHTWPL